MKTGPKPRTREEAWEHLCKTSRRTVEGCLLIEYGQSIGIGYKTICAGGHSWYIHHLADFIANGAAPLGTVRRHVCDRPNCIEPSHIIRGTHADNVEDKVSKRRHCFGEKHYRSKLTAEQVQEIRASTKTYAELGREYGISRGGIHNIKNSRSWKIETRSQDVFIEASIGDFQGGY